MFRFIHAADVHLDSPLKGLEQYEGAPVDEIRRATRRALENLVELAIDREVDFVLLAGDLYDGDWKDYNTGLFLVSQIVKLRDAGIAAYIITGNHDAENKMTRSLRLPENPDGSPVMLSSRKPETVLPKGLGAAIHGRGFASPKVPENVVDDYPQHVAGMFNIGVLHTSLDSESNDQHASYAPCRIADLVQKNYQYWALGHIHKRAIRHEEPWIVFPGNVQGRHIRESGAKGCVLVSVDDQLSATAEFVPVDVLRWEECHIDASEFASTDDAWPALAAELSRLSEQHEQMPLAVRVFFFGRSAAHDQLISDLTHVTNQCRATALDAAGGRIWVEKVKLHTLPSRQPQELLTADGPLGELMQYCAELQSDDEQLRELSEQFIELRRKLPDEIWRGNDAMALDDPARLRELLNQIQSLLSSRLLEDVKS